MTFFVNTAMVRTRHRHRSTGHECTSYGFVLSVILLLNAAASPTAQFCEVGSEAPAAATSANTTSDFSKCSEWLDFLGLCGVPLCSFIADCLQLDLQRLGLIFLFDL
jgi:hypothetical protein